MPFDPRCSGRVQNHGITLWTTSWRKGMTRHEVKLGHLSAFLFKSMVSPRCDIASLFADLTATSKNGPVKRVATLAVAAALMLSACSQGTTTSPSAASGKPNDFCHAMAAAVALAPPAATALDTLLTTIDAMAAGSKDGDIANLHTVGGTATTASEAYAAALGTAASVAPATMTADITSLQNFWKLYAVGVGQIAQGAASYGSLVDQATALSTSAQAAALIKEQPAAQKRINAGYLTECAG